jgi:hypothetical protein
MNEQLNEVPADPRLALYSAWAAAHWTKLDPISIKAPGPLFCHLLGVTPSQTEPPHHATLLLVAHLHKQQHQQRNTLSVPHGRFLSRSFLM